MFTLTKTACHQWKVTVEDTSIFVPMHLYTYNDVLLDDELLLQDGELEIDLSDYDPGDDGVYYLEVVSAQAYTDPEDPGGEIPAEMHAIPAVYYLCIYDFCDTEACYKALFKYVLCKCNDPCDEECMTKYKIAEKRNDLELIYALYMTIDRLVYYERAKYEGAMTIDTERSALMSQVGRAVEKLKVVVNRCGMCEDEELEDITC